MQQIQKDVKAKEAADGFEWIKHTGRKGSEKVKEFNYVPPFTGFRG